MFRLRVLGGFALEGPSGASLPSLPQRRAEAVLAVLAVCGDLGCTRERLIALLWPESDETHSRHSLRDSLRAIRQTLGPDAVPSAGDLLRLDPSVVVSDVASIAQALSADRHAEAVRAYGGRLLEGFHVDGAPEFERWLDAERARLARENVEALEKLATAAERAGAWDEAAGWWARAVERDPVNSYFVLHQVRALAALGDRANAIKVADGHARRLREELDLEPDREVLAKIERIRRGELLTPQDYPVPPGSALPATRPPIHADPTPAPEPASPSGGASAPGKRPDTQARGPWPPWAGAVAAAVIVALLAVLVFRGRPLIVGASDFVQVTDDPGVEFQPAISPDGNEVAYVAGPIGLPRPYVRTTGNVSSGAAIRLGDSTIGSGWLPAWSADGQVVRFLGCRTGWESDCDWLGSGRLGGLARRIQRDLPSTAADAGAEVAWSPDGARVAFVKHDTIVTASAGDTTRHLVAVHRAGRGEPHSLAWSPDSRYIAYANSYSGWRRGMLRVAGASIWMVDARGGVPQRVTDEDHLNVSPAWLDERHLLFVSDRDGPRGLYVVAVGPHGARGAARPVPGVADPHSISYSIAARKLAFSKLTARQNIWSYPLGSAGAVSIRAGRPVTTGTQVIEAHDVSPDGRWIAYNGGRRGNSDLYKLPLAGGEAVLLTETPLDEAQPRWSPDGQEIAFYVRDPRRTVWAMSADGSNPTRVADEWFGSRPKWSLDGLRLVFLTETGARPEGRDWRTMVVRRDRVGGTWRAPSPLSDVPFWPLALAPDGTGVLCESHRAGELVFLSWAGQTLWRREIPFGWFELAQYSRDGKTLYFDALRDDGRQGVWAVAGGGRGAARLVVAFDDPKLQGTQWISVSKDRLYLSVAEFESDIWVAKLRY